MNNKQKYIYTFLENLKKLKDGSSLVLIINKKNFPDITDSNKIYFYKKTNRIGKNVIKYRNRTFKKYEIYNIIEPYIRNLDYITKINIFDENKNILFIYDIEKNICSFCDKSLNNLYFLYFKNEYL